MVKIPVGFYQKNRKAFHLLFIGILLVNGTIGYFVKSYYGFPDIQSMEVVFFTSVILHFIAVQVLFKKRIREYNTEQEKKKLSQ